MAASARKFNILSMSNKLQGGLLLDIRTIWFSICLGAQWLSGRAGVL